MINYDVVDTRIHHVYNGLKVQVNCTSELNNQQAFFMNKLKSSDTYKNMDILDIYKKEYERIDKITEVARAFGLGQKTGLELPDEITGTLSSPNSMPSGDVWTGGKTVQTAIGQLYNDFTPIQMAKYTAMLANGGKNIELTIVKSINNPDGTQVSRNEIESYVNEALGVSGNSGSDLSLSSDTIAAIRQGMKGVTSDDGGTAYSYFKDFNIEVGGKTGSASNDNSGNANAWFIGFAPFNDPEIAVAVYVKNGQHGGYTAPIAREIFAQYLGMNASQITEDTTATSDMQQIR